MSAASCVRLIIGGAQPLCQSHYWRGAAEANNASFELRGGCKSFLPPLSAESAVFNFRNLATYKKIRMVLDYSYLRKFEPCVFFEGFYCEPSVDSTSWLIDSQLNGKSR